MRSSFQRRMLAVCAARAIANKNQVTTYQRAVTNLLGHGPRELQNNDYLSLISWNYIGFVAQSALTGRVLRFEAFSFKHRLFFPLGRKYLAQEPGCSALPAAQSA